MSVYANLGILILKKLIIFVNVKKTKNIFIIYFYYYYNLKKKSVNINVYNANKILISANNVEEIELIALNVYVQINNYMMIN